MTDPYMPALNTFLFSEDDIKAIELALAKDMPWDWKPKGAVARDIKSVKDKIRAFHMLRHNHRCCYCRRDLKDGGHFMVDREHILPKSFEAYRHLTFCMWNLSVSCKRCNMEYKKNKDDFVVVKDDPGRFEESGNYFIIHPNFDKYKDHISKSSIEYDDIVVVKFTKKAGSAKGAFTYDYFNLAGMEREMANDAQGVMIVADPSEAGLQVRRLAEEANQ